jgi:SPP1 family predicted phage head-tail adaptor
MRAGKFDRRIVIQEAISSPDEYGQPIQTWTTFAERLAQKLDVRAQERFEAAQEIATETTTFRIRYLAGVLPTMRVVCEGKTYDIRGIAELGRRRGLDITCEARAD